jgi:hypothetical protein
MRRRHQERSVCLRHWREHNRLIHDNVPTGCACDEQIGRFRKQRGLGCGRARCQLCYFEKIHGIKSLQERLADLRFREQLMSHD